MLKKSLIFLSLLLFICGSSLVQARELELLEVGVYPYFGVGGGLGLLLGPGEGRYSRGTPQAQGQSVRGFYSVTAGLLWKKRAAPGWQSMFQISFSPYDYRERDGSSVDVYRANRYAFEFLESFGFYNSWAPFIGVSWGLYELGFRSTGRAEGSRRLVATTNAFGFVFGWDLLAKPTSRWRFRSTFRYYLDVRGDFHHDGRDVSYPNFEIQPLEVIFRI